MKGQIIKYYLEKSRLLKFESPDDGFLLLEKFSSLVWLIPKLFPIPLNTWDDNIPISGIITIIRSAIISTVFQGNFPVFFFWNNAQINSHNGHPKIVRKTIKASNIKI
jgi:hypothetical protein